MIEHFFSAHALMVALLGCAAIVLGMLCYFGLLWATETGRDKRPWKAAMLVCVTVLFSVLVSGCDAPINPVKYQTVEVLVTKACFAGRTPPAEANTLTRTTCERGECVVMCMDNRPEVCVTHATADILELQREAKQFRNLFKECSK